MQTIELKSVKPKLCCDCAHYLEQPDFLFCDLVINLLNGGNATCEQVRSNGALCGHKGSLWEAKQQSEGA